MTRHVQEWRPVASTLSLPRRLRAFYIQFFVRGKY